MKKVGDVSWLGLRYCVGRSETRLSAERSANEVR